VAIPVSCCRETRVPFLCYNGVWLFRFPTRKVYDLAGRHIPEALLSAPEPNETEEQYQDWYVLRRTGSIGLLWNRSGDAWLGMRGIKSKDREAALARLIERGQVVEVQVEGVGQPLYMRGEDRATLDEVLQAKPPPPCASILAPLDNLLWDRRLVEELFGFTYVWEVYKPAAERQYGYYVLPVLCGDQFVARFEPGRAKGDALTIENWWWEDEVALTEARQCALRDCFGQFVSYLGREDLQIDGSALDRAGLDWLLSWWRLEGKR
jgi:uncharacterized protein YcaQ